MYKNLGAQITFRAAYLAVAVIGLLLSVGVWTEFKPFFFTDFFNWAIIMTIVSTVAALIENLKSLNSGKTEDTAMSFPLLRFCSAGSMLFALLLGLFFVGRVGEDRLVGTLGYGDIFPGLATAGYWARADVLLPRFVLPAAYIVMFVLFYPRMKTRGIYATLGILPPTLFYFFDMFFGMIMSGAYGGADKLVEAGMYGVAYPYFFQDSAFTYTGWWWILIWPTIFGVSLMILNNAVFFLTRTYKDENGKLRLDRKTKPDESELCDIIHYFKMKRAEKKSKSE